MEDRKTREKISLKVPGVNTDDATHKVTAMGCFGKNGPYLWLGSGPEYDEHGNFITVAE